MKTEYERSKLTSNSQIYNTIKDYSGKIVRSFKNRVPLSSEPNTENYIKALILLLLTLNHPNFEEEIEVRFACLNHLEAHEMLGGGYHNQSPYEICSENKAPRLKIDFNPLATKKIIIGPQPNPEQMEIVIRYLLENINVNTLILLNCRFLLYLKF